MKKIDINHIQKIMELKNQAIKQAIKYFKLYEMDNWDVSPTFEHRNFMRDMKYALKLK